MSSLEDLPLFCNYLYFEKGGDPSFEKKIESSSPKDILCQKVEIHPVVLEKKIFKLELSSPKDALCQDWLKLAQWFWRRRFLKVVNVFLLFPNYLPFGKGMALHLNKLESPLTGDTLCQV